MSFRNFLEKVSLDIMSYSSLEIFAFIILLLVIVLLILYIVVFWRENF